MSFARSLKFRPIAILVSSVYVTWVYRTFYSNYTLHIPKELTRKISQVYEDCKNLRQSRPNVFCGFVASTLFLLAIIGHVVSGTYILLGEWPWIPLYATRINFRFHSLASLVCLIAAVLLTSKYEIRIIKENGKTRSASCFTHGIFLWIVVRDVTSWYRLIFCINSEWEKRLRGKAVCLLENSFLASNVRFSSNFYFLSRAGCLRFMLTQQKRRKC